MLAGQPELFSSTELQLLGFQTLAERKVAYTGKFALWLEGTLRMIMEVKQCSADEAARIMTAFEDRGLTTKAMYRILQEWIGDRMLVDKSPSYSLDRRALDKAEQDFDNPVYVHLIRHPVAMLWPANRCDTTHLLSNSLRAGFGRIYECYLWSENSL